MVKNWDNLTRNQREKKLRLMDADPEYFLRDKYFMGDFVDQPFPLQVYIMRKLWMPINTVGGRPGNYVREIDLLAGMRTGKTATMGMSSGYVGAKLNNIFLRSGKTPGQHFGLLSTQDIMISNTAVNEDQSKFTVFAITRGLIETSPYYQQLTTYDMYKGHIHFTDLNLYVLAMGSNSSSGAGKTAALVTIDEVDQFDDTEGSQGIDAVFKLLRNSTKTLWIHSKGEYGKFQAISSSGMPGSKMWRIRTEAIKSKGARIWMLVPTWYDKEHNPLGNPNIGFEDLEEERLADPEAFWRLFGCNPRYSGKLFFKDYEGIVAPCFDGDLRNILEEVWKGIQQIKRTEEYAEIPDEKIDQKLELVEELIGDYVDEVNISNNQLWIMTGDPSKKSDAFGIALGYADMGKKPIRFKAYQYNAEGKLKSEDPVMQKFNNIVVTGLFRFKPDNLEIPVEDIEALFRATHALVPYRRAGFDTWAYPRLQTHLRKRGIYIYNRLVQFSEFISLKNAMQSRALTMCPYSHAEIEARELQQTTTTERVRIDHPKDGSKDVLDAIALVQFGGNMKMSEKHQVKGHVVTTGAKKSRISSVIMASTGGIGRATAGTGGSRSRMISNRRKR